MKSLLLTLLLVTTLQLQSAGQGFRFYDTFDDNHNRWYEGEGAIGKATIQNGKMLVSCNKDGWISYQRPAIAYGKDFTMQASFRQIDGIDNNGVGLLWGYNRKSGIENYFIVNAIGSYYISDSGPQTDVKKPGIREWVTSKAIKGMGQANILKVEQKSGTLTFSINDEKVFSCNAFEWPGAEIGFITYVKMTFEMDDFIFDQGLKINLSPNMTTGYVKENLGPNINTPADEVSPAISVDGQTLYFGRENWEGNVGGVNDGEDYFMSTFDGKQWTPGQNMGSPINDTGVNNILAVSSDNNSVLFATATEFKIRKRTLTGWSEPESLGVNFINEGSNFESTLSADGKAILFTARNTGNLRYVDDGFKQRDIFVSLQGQDGKWSAPINLGPDINTNMDEISPFLAADGRTLYFSSEGRPGYGNHDVFVSKRIGDGWTKWSEPVNMGPEINTPDFDAYYVLPASGDYAIMASTKNSIGKSDIIRVFQPVVAQPKVTPKVPVVAETKPDPVVLVRGKTLDAKTKAPISTDIHIENLDSRKEVGEAISDPATGDYKIILPYGANYGFHASVPGYLSVNENLELVTVSKYVELEKNLYLVPIQVGANIQLNNVFFEQGRPILKAESYPELDRLVTIMQDNPGMEIELHGYTDNNGRETSLIVLSMDRVGAVKKYMTSKGILAKRITGKGFGPANPIVKNDTEEHRRMNRRVEFKVIKK